ncbi:MAG: hypothetical protein LQ340_008122 [Diploschistes diacapsis]|nr:MAG: hypothetical protein LQ340_008122 [Diploschistes diacapsis]
MSTTSNPDSSLHRTRWEGDSELTMYTKFFKQPAMHDALRKFKATLDGHNARHASSAEPISLTEASLRLVMYHLALRGEHGDAIILDAKREEQLKGNLEACRKGPLPEEPARAGEEMWRAVRGCNEEKDTYL